MTVRVIRPGQFVADETERLLGEGLDRTAISAALGYDHPYSLLRALTRADRRDLAQALTSRTRAPEHGSTRYKNGTCRCTVCRAANTEYQRTYRRTHE